MRQWSTLFQAFRRVAASGIDRFPIAIAVLAANAVVINLDIGGWITITEDELVRTSFALVGAAVIATAITLASERRRGTQFARHGLSLVFACLLGTALWFWDRLGIAFPALFAAAVLAIPLAPYLQSGGPGFWDFLWRLVHAAALAFITVIIFCLGLSAIFATLDYLFGVDIDDSLYGHVWSIGLGFVGPVFALSLIPTKFPDRDAPVPDQIFVAGLRMISDFVAVPLLAVYVAILHVYALKIVFEGELPRGQIGWMVLTFGLAVLALRIAVQPMAYFARLPTWLFLRFWAVGLVVPLVLLFVAVWQRVDTYGVTPERYALALFGLFLGLVILAQILPRFRGDIRVIPALGALALLVASLGPWSMLPVSARSQIDRLTQHLAEAGALEGSAIAKHPEFSRAAAEDVQSIIGMLDSIGQTDRLRPLFARWPDNPFAGEDSRADQWKRLPRIRQALGINVLPPLRDQAGSFAISRGSGGATIGGYDVVVPHLSLANNGGTTVTLGDSTVDIRSNGMTIEIISTGLTLRITAAELGDAFKRRIETVETLPESDRPPFLVELTLEDKRIALLFESATGNLTTTDFRLSEAWFDLFLRRADWRR